MSDERKQSPHYIPELDPDNEKSGPEVKQHFLWTVLVMGVALSFAGAWVLLMHDRDWGIVVMAIGLMLLGSLIPFGTG